LLFFSLLTARADLRKGEILAAGLNSAWFTQREKAGSI
jgi:hypothetical protein